MPDASTDSTTDEKKKRPVNARTFARAANVFSSENLALLSAEDLLFLRDTTLPAMKDAVVAECQKMADKLAGK